MPIYEYRCHNCRKKFNRLLLSFKAAADDTPACPYCKSPNARRLVSRVYSIKGGGSLESADEGSDPMADIDENDPRSMGRLMRRMSDESGEEMPPEMNEVIHRLEAGHDPEDIEKDMPDLGADEPAEAPGLPGE